MALKPFKHIEVVEERLGRLYKCSQDFIRTLGPPAIDESPNYIYNCLIDAGLYIPTSSNLNSLSCPPKEDLYFNACDTTANFCIVKHFGSGKLLVLYGIDSMGIEHEYHLQPRLSRSTGPVYAEDLEGKEFINLLIREQRFTQYYHQ